MKYFFLCAVLGFALGQVDLPYPPAIAKPDAGDNRPRGTYKPLRPGKPTPPKKRVIVRAEEGRP